MANKPTLVRAGSDMPDVALMLGNATMTPGGSNFTQLCNISIDLSQAPLASAAAASGYTQITAGLTQNGFQGCVPYLEQITAFSFVPNGNPSVPVSFCLDEISLLPSTLQTGD